MKKFRYLPLLLLLLFAACSTPVPPDDPSVNQVLMTNPESDNDFSWSMLAQVEVYTQAYTVSITVAEEMVSNKTLQGEGSVFGYGGYVSGSMRIWQEGKGLLPVRVNSISPLISLPGMDLTGKTIILKTSDLKAMGLPNGATTTLVCNLDTEVLSPVTSSQTLTTDRLTYELDACRMLTPAYTMPPSP